MRKVRLNEHQRKVLGDKLADLGNIAVGSLVFGYVARSEVFDAFSLTLGLAIAAAAYIYAVALGK